MDNTEANTAILAREIRKGLKTIGATMVKQNYKGTGSQKARRQLWCRFNNNAVIDLWLGQNNTVQLSGVVANGGKGPINNVSYNTGDDISTIADNVVNNVRIWKDGI